MRPLCSRRGPGPRARPGAGAPRLLPRAPVRFPAGRRPAHLALRLSPLPGVLGTVPSQLAEAPPCGGGGHCSGVLNPRFGFPGWQGQPGQWTLKFTQGDRLGTPLLLGLPLGQPGPPHRAGISIYQRLLGCGRPSAWSCGERAPFASTVLLFCPLIRGTLEPVFREHLIFTQVLVNFYFLLPAVNFGWEGSVGEGQISCPGAGKTSQGPAGAEGGPGGAGGAWAQWPACRARPGSAAVVCKARVGAAPTCPDSHCVLGTNLGWPDGDWGWRLTARAV